MVERDDDVEPAAGAEDAMKFVDRAMWVADVLEDGVALDRADTGVADGELLDVRDEIDVWCGDEIDGEKSVASRRAGPADEQPWPGRGRQLRLAAVVNERHRRAQPAVEPGAAPGVALRQLVNRAIGVVHALSHPPRFSRTPAA